MMRSALLRCLLTAALLLTLGAAAAEAQFEMIGAFRYHQGQPSSEEVDPSYAYTVSTSDFDDHAGRLIWACLSDGLNVMAVVGTFFAGDDDDDILVRYRVDAQPAPEARYWPLDLPNETAFMPMGMVHDFTAAAQQGRQLTLRLIDPYDGETVQYDYPLEGLSVVLSRLGCAG